MPAFEPTPDEPRLESWKAIAVYLNRDVRTAKRWEVREGLPIHRHQHESRSSVYAYPREIDRWREGRKPVGSSAESQTEATRRPWMALAAALVVSLLTAGGGGVALQGRPQAPVNVPVLHCETCADFYGSVSRDGSTMAVVVALSDVSDIGLYDVPTGRMVPLQIEGSGVERDGAPLAPVFSPDGGRIAYTWAKGRQPSELRIVSREAGPKFISLINNPEFQYLEPVGWSGPDTIVVFLRRPDLTWEVATVSSTGGDVTRIKSLGWRTPNAIHSASVSPDGRFLAFAALASNPDAPPTPQQGAGLERQIFVMPLAATGDEVAITTGSGAKNNPVWTPDGRHVLFTSNVTGATDLWARGVANGGPVGEPRLVRKGVGDIASLGMSDSGVLHYYEGRAGVFRAEFTSLNRDSTSIPSAFVGQRPTWSPDGSTVAVSRDRADGNGRDLVVRHLVTGDDRVYDIRRLQPIPFDWMPDGHRVLVATGGQTIQVLDLESKALTAVPGQDPEVERRAANPRALSPDGRTLYQPVFRPQSDPDAVAVQDRIVAVDIETGASRPVLALPLPDSSLPRGAQDFALAVSRDGKSLALAIRDRGIRATRIAIVGVDGQGYRELVPPVASNNIRNKLAWSADGMWIYAVSGGDNFAPYRIVRVPAQGGQVEDIGIEIDRLDAMSISPDGATLAYSTLNPEGAGELLWSLDVAAILGTGR